MKKIIALISALMLFAGAASCSKKSGNSNNPKSFTAESLSDISYKKSSVPLPDDISMIYRFTPFNKNSEYLIVGSGSETVGFWRVDSEFTNFRDLGIKNFDYGSSYDINITENGTIVVFIVTVDHGDAPEPDYSDSAAVQQYEANAEYGFHMRTYSLEGEMLTDNEVTGFPVQPGADVQITGLASDGEIVIVCVNSTYEAFKIDGSYIGTVSTDSGEYIENIGRDDNGSVVCAVSGEDFFRIDKLNDDGTLEKSSVNYSISGSVYDEIIPGRGNYSMFFRSMSDIYGIRSDDSSIEPLFSVNRSGLTADKVAGFAIASDGNFIIPIKDYSDWSCSLKKFTPCSPEELENIPHITLGMPLQDQVFLMENTIEYFNENHDNFQVDVKTYINGDSSDADKEMFSNQITQDALSGDLPDVLMLNDMGGYFGDSGFGINLIEKEALCDMLDFMENDDTLNEDAFLPAAINTLIKGSQDGHAYAMPNRFELDIGYVGKTKFVGDIADNWGFDSYMDLLENKPEGMGMRYYNEGNTIYDRIHFDWYYWIDFKNASCRFNSPEFIRQLKYAGDGDPITDDYYSPAEMTEEELLAESNMFTQQYVNDKAILSNKILYDYYDYLSMTKGTFGGEPITILGDVNTCKPLITPTFNNIFAITKNSEHKEEAWEFVKFMFSDEYYKKNGFGNGFPVTKSGRELLVEYSQTPQSYDETMPEFMDYTGYIYDNGINPDGTADIIGIGEITDEMIAEVDKLIDEAVIGSYSFVNEGNSEQNGVIAGIYQEETERFFNGEITAEQCAELLQNRISLYLSEQFG
jgi:lipoprotein